VAEDPLREEAPPPEADPEPIPRAEEAHPETVRADAELREETLRAEDPLPEAVPEPIPQENLLQGLRRDRAILLTGAALLPTADRGIPAEEREDFV